MSSNLLNYALKAFKSYTLKGGGGGGGTDLSRGGKLPLGPPERNPDISDLYALPMMENSQSGANFV